MKKASKRRISLSAASAAEEASEGVKVAIADILVHALGEIEALYPGALLIGVDEVGLGALAGPVVAGAVVLDPLLPVAGVDDSKKLSPNQRLILDQRIRRQALFVGIGEVPSEDLDRWGLSWASDKAKHIAVTHVLNQIRVVSPERLHIVVDGEMPIRGLTGYNQSVFIKGDQRSFNIAAASIVAKIHRDHWMTYVAATTYPAYGFQQHKGYGTRAHKEMLALHGPCPLHRASLRPLKKLLRGEPLRKRTRIIGSRR